jgi:iron complex outermembrane receptor protein
VFRFEGVKADFRGVEADARFHLVDRGDHNIHLDLRTDYTRAQNDSSGEPLPRISPLRFSAAVSAQKGPTSVRVEAIRAAAQNRTAPDELATDGYTLVNARVTHLILKEGQAELELFLRASNLLNQEIRIHTSLLKDLAPLGGRSVMVGVNGTF